MANKAIAIECPESNEIEVRPEIVPQIELDLAGKSGRFALSVLGSKRIRTIKFSKEIFSMEDDMILFNAVHEMLHCACPERKESEVEDQTWKILEKHFQIHKTDFMSRYGRFYHSD